MQEQILYYDVDGTTLTELARQMRQRGPNGYWGYAQWWINWSARCEITLTGTITMPRHSNPGLLSPRSREVWQDMIKALLAHERLHLSHGVQAAAQIEAEGCQDANSIIAHWAEQDRILDVRTRHGTLDGVDLE